MVDAAAHTLAQLISACDYPLVKNDAKNFLNYVIDSQEEKSRVLTPRCMTNCLVSLLKHNELSEQFIDRRGF
jgi:hypothetical protein